ncbi:uncharacterized protein LOC115733391 isoform X2 [Rhodamnia argentea]|uniref:Uncharacterized protein LOC115733391 isoform X2 n=1 Tax=Rhodamnia argentea TaxID=178133 RepID=A0ABM3GUW8_9MYRT|nr:uncharacterized protein LOC115733391 isoform X2 [Rhodamnia argentea]
MGIEEIERCISSSASIHQWKYDVFVSFRGKDIRKTFAAHLFHALRQAGIYYFRDNEKLETGIFIEPKLLDAIRHSRVALVVFTTNYADSRWCLNELVEVLECNRRFRDHQGHVVLPIFYDVEPGDIRRQSGRFGDGFERCLATHTDDLLVQKWKDALKEAGNLSGWHLNNDANGDQSNFIEQIVGHLYRISPTRISPYFVKNAIGVDSFVEDVISLLEIGSEDDVRVVGIWGMKGIGKTTLAKVVCDRVFREFEGVSLLENVGDANQDTLLLLQKRLLHDVLKVQGLELFDLNSNINEIKTKLCRKRILLVLDNITKKDQIDYFGAGDREWFRNGSRIVITTRDEQLLEDLKVDNKYMLPGLTHKESLQLLSRHAFRKDHPQEGYGELSESLVHYTGGLPIALKRFGSFLSKKRKNQWHEILEKLVRDPHLDSVGLPLEPFSSVLPFQSLGPYGGHGGRPYDDKTYTDVRRITLVVTSVIESFYIEYDQNGSLVRSPIHGGPAEGKICTVKLDYPNEFLTSVSGYIRENEGPVVIQSLIFHSNRRTYGPFGNGRGRFFSFPPVAGKIIGFFGRCGIFVDSIGAYLLPISHSYPFEVVGPFGNCNYEDRWDDDKHIDVREIELVSGSAIESITVTYEQGCSFAHGIASGGGTTNKVNLDYPREFLTSMSGYTRHDNSVIQSLTFESNIRRHGPFGKEEGSFFSCALTCNKIIGFHGRSGIQLDALGVYSEPVSDLHLLRSIGPFGGQGGSPWDDGESTGVRGIIVRAGVAIVSITVEYDKNGSVVLGPKRGEDGGHLAPEIKLDYPREYLTSFSGHSGIFCGHIVVRSLTFQSNERTFGPFGEEIGKYFSFPSTGKKIVGFHGRCGSWIDSLGAHFET